MLKKIIIALLIIAAFLVYEFRYELLFKFQYSRLKTLACQAGGPDFKTDSCLNKIWPHRVNSVERLNKMQDKFFGYETDIAWDRTTGQFFVYHPPLKDIPISLDSFLPAANLDKRTFWFDTRETPAADTSHILSALNKLDSVHHLRLGAILELYDTTVANFLADHGYWVALNISTEWIQKFSRESQWEQLRNAMSPKISFVSQEDTYVPLLKKHFPGKDIITWSIAFNNCFNRKHLRALISDDRVKVVLVNIKSRYYR